MINDMIKRKKKRRNMREETALVLQKGSPRMVLYCRVSRADLNLQNQIDEFLAKFPHLAGIEIHTEVIEGDGDRKVLYRLLDELAPGSTIYTIAIDRLSRNLKDLLQIVEVCEQREIGIMLLRQGSTLTNLDRAAVVILGLVAEMEKKNISERTKSGIARVRKENENNPKRLSHWGYGLAKYRGRKLKKMGKMVNPIYTKALPDIKEMRSMGFTLKRIAEYMTKIHNFEFSIENVSRLINHGHG